MNRRIEIRLNRLEQIVVPAKTVPQRIEVVYHSDAQLYALALYLYSLRPPANPQPVNSSSERGRIVFEKENCSECHTPSFYTNNKLVAAEGFDPPPAAPEVPVRIGVDPRFALQTRRGTGYYKVPALRGLWYRGPFDYNGAAATLEDRFDPARTEAEYVPTSFKGYDGKTRSIPGHRFGLQLTLTERGDLIAFLKTLKCRTGLRRRGTVRDPLWMIFF